MIVEQFVQTRPIGIDVLILPEKQDCGAASTKLVQEDVPASPLADLFVLIPIISRFAKGLPKWQAEHLPVPEAVIVLILVETIVSKIRRIADTGVI